MDDSNPNIKIDITVDNSGTEKGVAEAQAQLEKLSSSANKFGTNYADMNNAAAASSEKLINVTERTQRGFNALASSVVSGETSRIPGALVNIASGLSPIGLGLAAVTAALGVGAYAWYKWGDDADEAAKKVQSAIDKAQAAAEKSKHKNKEEQIQDIRWRQESIRGEINAIEMEIGALQKRRQVETSRNKELADQIMQQARIVQAKRAEYQNIERNAQELQAKQDKTDDGSAKILAERERAIDAANKALDKARTSSEEYIKQIEFENTLIGKNAQEVKLLTEQRRIDLALEREQLALRSNSAFKDRDKDPVINQQYQRAVAGTQKSAQAERAAAPQRMEAQDNAALYKEGSGMDSFKQEDEGYKRRLKAADAYRKADIANAQASDKMMQMIKSDHEAKLVELGRKGALTRDQMSKLSARNQITIASGMMQDIVGASAEHSQVMFQIAKAAKLAEAAMNVHSSVSKAYDAGSVWGPAVGAAFGAVAFAAQMINLQAIASSEFGGGGSSAAAGGGMSATAVPGQSANPNQVSSQTPPPSAPTAQTVQTFNLTIEGAKESPDKAVLSYNSLVNDVIPLLQQAKDNGHLVDFNLVAA